MGIKKGIGSENMRIMIINKRYMNVPLFIRRIFALGVLCFVGILSLMPSQLIPPVDGFFQMDKLVHGLMYFFVVISVLSAFNYSKLNNKWLFVFSGCLSYGMMMEVLQYILPIGRHFSWFDMLANTIGCIVGAYVHVNYFAIKKEL